MRGAEWLAGESGFSPPLERSASCPSGSRHIMAPGSYFRQSAMPHTTTTMGKASWQLRRDFWWGSPPMETLMANGSIDCPAYHLGELSNEGCDEMGPDGW